MKVLTRYYARRTLALVGSTWLAVSLALAAMQVGSSSHELSLDFLMQTLALNAVRMFPMAAAIALALGGFVTLSQRESVLLGSSAIGPRAVLRGTFLGLLLLSFVVLCLESATSEIQASNAWFSKRDKRAARDLTLLVVGEGHVVSARVVGGHGVEPVID